MLILKGTMLPKYSPLIWGNTDLVEFMQVLGLIQAKISILPCGGPCAFRVHGGGTGAPVSFNSFCLLKSSNNLSRIRASFSVLYRPYKSV